MLPIVFLIAIVILAAAWCVRWLWLRSQLQQRLFNEPFADGAGQLGSSSIEDMSWLRRWLFLAGYRTESAPLIFVLVVLVCAVVAGSLSLAMWLSGVYALLLLGVQGLPGGVGDVFFPAAVISPWLILLMVIAMPFFWVRRQRFQRVEMIEQDMPLVLELLATLGESGIGFDAALPRILDSRLERRPLATEFRTFQADLLAGRPRVASFRRLSRRVQISSMSIFISALVQAEQLGMGVAQVLRRQADDLRDRRRERANAFAQSLVVKRLFPMVICFLPGLFVWTLGPFFVQLFQLVDSLTRTR